EQVIENFPSDNSTNPTLFPNIDSDMTYALTWCLGLFLVACSFVVFPIEERSCGSKQLQLMTGMKPATYWLGHAVGDTAITISAMLIAVILFASINASGVFLAHGGSATGESCKRYKDEIDKILRRPMMEQNVK
ncbi:unnamed protein product, partial [Notodromas monacha]